MKTINRISDFAKSLLHELKFGQDAKGEFLGLGKVPIVFVVHSMGGLVAKATYLLGQNDQKYEDIVQSIRGMIFLATPHRGADQAAKLNDLLRASFQSPRDFIGELQRGSPAVEDINEQFRHIAPRMNIASFYETRPTKVGKFQFMVVNKDSATLGYQQEISAGLKADHHEVCKYSSRQDSNYATVRNTLASFIADLKPEQSGSAASIDGGELVKLEKLLSISPTFQEDLFFFRSWRLQGTCGWIFESRIMDDWLDMAHDVSVIHLRSPPASGKNMIMEMFRKGVPLTVSNSGDVFRKLFEIPCVGLKFSHPIFWVIDAIDESESSKAVLGYLSRLQDLVPDMRILVSDRGMNDFVGRMRKLTTISASTGDSLDSISNSSDIQVYLDRSVREMGGGNALKEQVSRTILSRAQGNFLWVRLVLDEILNCHTEEAIQEALQTIPEDMNELYARMEQAIQESSRAEEKSLAQQFLRWVVCSRHTLTLDELNQAMNVKFVDLRKTVERVCGQFVTVDASGHARLIHQTAREYLTRTATSTVAVNLFDSHGKLFEACISALSSPGLSVRVRQSQHQLRHTEAFIVYAATSWMYHLQQMGEMNDMVITLLSQFLRGHSVLVWIHILATINQLDVLIKSAQSILTCVKKNRRMNASKNPLLHRLSELDYLEQWSVDFGKLVGKFSGQLLSCPSGIYDLVAPFCPSSSNIYRQFYKDQPGGIVVSGIMQQDWNDNLFRITLPRGEQGIKICCAAQYVTVLCTSGTAYVWNANHFEQICILKHGEAVTAVTFNRHSDRILTYGLRTTKLWSIPAGDLLASTKSPPTSRALAITISEKDNQAFVACTNSLVYSLNLENVTAGWSILSQQLLRETSDIGGTTVSSPRCVAFNGTASLVGVSYRGFPLSIWDMDEMRCIARCKRPMGPQKEPGHRPSGWFAVDRFTWNPITGHIIGLYKDGTVFKWHPVTSDYHEAPSMADEVAASPDGRLFVTSSSNGTVKVWNFDFLSVVYQLSSGDLVSELAFGPDNARFYDIRGSSLNAWQSNSLLRFLELEESFSDTSSEDHRSTSFSHVSEARSTPYESIAVISAAGRGYSLYCAGNEEGIVTLFDADVGRIEDIVHFPNFMSVSCLAWSKDSKYMACADLAGDVEVRSISSKTVANSAKPSVKIDPKPKPQVGTEASGIHVLVFNRDCTLLLIVSERYVHICSVHDGSLIVGRNIAQIGFRKWIDHPTEPDKILAFSTKDVTAYRWSDLTEITSWQYGSSAPVSPKLRNKTSLFLNRVIESPDCKYVVLQLLSQDSGEVSVLIFDLSSLHPCGVQERNPFPLAHNVSPEVAAQVDIPLGFLPGSRLVFLDENLWVCTSAFGSSSTHKAVKRHYFIPRDWANVEDFRQCKVMENGTVLCPRQDEVAVIGIMASHNI
ncbi:hypothetical protein EYZ11_011591 [Aspergillus tanneri]|uniref:Uncharacterized protein n=1 Tax=Aspergillus tanneri TaxID=1220188 RepID=A0A4S3J7R5_9EURO|nr:hypothetical protein EYZ11_011591 [Aspergillus tanneri]